MKTIWTLFGVENNYDQPEHNLVAWWIEKPDFATLAKALSYEFPSKNDADTLFVIRVWEGQNTQERVSGTSYTLKEIPEGILVAAR